MDIKPLKLSGTYEIFLEPRYDERGYFMRYYDESIFSSYGLNTQWVQENQSISKNGVIRGLHFQNSPYAETKLRRVILGKGIEVFVDLRKSSPTYGQWDMVEISSEKNNLVYIPGGFATGFGSMADNTILLYKVNKPYHPESEGGLRWNDTYLNILWPIKEPEVSVKDANWDDFENFTSPFD